MGRFARVVVPGVPHHVIQRGNRRQTVFFHEGDKKLYLSLLGYNCRKEDVLIWCYCLMDNHVHLIAVPRKSESLAKAIGETHKKYTWIINFQNNWKGHLWQERFHSYAMDEEHLYLAVRYVELNPVRARVVREAEDYPWSSAPAHILGKTDRLLSPFYLTERIKDWRAYLREGLEAEVSEVFRKHESTGRPLGDEDFLIRLEKITGRILRKRKAGRPKKAVGEIR